MSAENPPDRKYTREHEWVRVDGSIATVGITRFAVEQLGDITMVDLPKEGGTVKKKDTLGTVESVKAVSDIYSPVSGKIVKVNTRLIDSPESLAAAPYDAGWMVQIEVSNPAELDELMDAAAYEAFLREHENG